MNQQNSSGLIKIITLLVCASGVAWSGFGLYGKYQQTQQFQQVNDLLAQEKYSSAITAYDRLLTANVPQRDLIWINKGYAFLGLKRYQDMLQSCSKATSIEPNAALGWNCQGEALYYLQREPDALEAFEKATNKNPQEATFWLNKARVLSDLGEYTEAIAASDKAIEFTKKYQKQNKAIAFNQKGQNLLKIGKYEESLAAFERSLENFSDYLSAQQGKGIALYELGNYEEAIAIFQKILQRDDLTEEQKAISLVYTGVSLCQREKINAADKVFAEVLELTANLQSQEIAEKGCGIR